MEVVIIEDTLTAGTTLKKTVADIKHTGARVSGIVVSVDRQEKDEKRLETACQNIEREYGVKVFSIVTLEDIINAMRNDIIGAGYLDAMIEYRNKYGGTHV